VTSTCALLAVLAAQQRVASQPPVDPPPHDRPAEDKEHISHSAVVSIELVLGTLPRRYNSGDKLNEGIRAKTGPLPLLNHSEGLS
jgi:hypothetical protein